MSKGEDCINGIYLTPTGGGLMLVEDGFRRWMCDSDGVWHRHNLGKYRHRTASYHTVAIPMEYLT